LTILRLFFQINWLDNHVKLAKTQAIAQNLKNGSENDINENNFKHKYSPIRVLINNKLHKVG